MMNQLIDITVTSQRFHRPTIYKIRILKNGQVQRCMVDLLMCTIIVCTTNLSIQIENEKIKRILKHHLLLGILETIYNSVNWKMVSLS